jgi:hypothetical protein
VKPRESVQGGWNRGGWSYANARGWRAFFILAVGLSAAFAGVGCAAPGEPIARHSAVPKAISDLHAAQQGSGFLLSFNLPSKTSTQKNLTSTPSISIYRSYVTASASAATIEHPELMVEIPSQMVSKYLQRGKVHFAIEIPADQLAVHQGQQILWMVRTQIKAVKQSDDSNVVALPVLQAFPAPPDLKATLTQDAVMLSWTDTLAAAADGTAEVHAAATPKAKNYRIYRADVTSPAPGAVAGASAPQTSPTNGSAPASATAIVPQSGGASASVEEVKPGAPPYQFIGETDAPPYRDTRFEFGRHYVYSVRAYAEYSTGSVESDDSNPVEIETKDVFVPAAPTGLVAIPVAATADVPAHIELSWAISAETDLAGYNVYRSDDQDKTLQKLNDKPLLAPTYRDMNVAPARSYSYSVTAVDRAANESSPSQPVLSGLPADSQEEK